MSQKVLEKLFDSPAKVRILKLFLRNPDARFTLSDIRKRTLLKSDVTKRHIDRLADIKLVRSMKKPKKNERFYFLNPDFIFLEELQNLVLKSSPIDEKRIKSRIKSLGKIKLAIISGIFLQPEPEDSRADLLIVGDAVSDRKLKSFIQSIEAEAGTELRYTVLTKEEFDYRYEMFDRFLFDIIEGPHKRLINRILS